MRGAPSLCAGYPAMAGLNHDISGDAAERGSVAFVGDHASAHILLWALAPTPTNVPAGTGPRGPTFRVGTGPRGPTCRPGTESACWSGAGQDSGEDRAA